MRKILFLIIAFIPMLFISCGNSLSGTEWDCITSGHDISIKFVDETNAIVKEGSREYTDVTYTYDKPKIVLSSASGNRELKGFIDNNRMTLQKNSSRSFEFLKK